VIALTRAVSPAIARCELTHLAREQIDYTRAVEQHHHYEGSLRSLGCSVIRLPSLPDNPDSVFVEDAAVVLSEIAVITRPGAESRRNETGSVAALLSRYRKIATIEPPGTMDGGDVLVIGSTIYVGESTRTNVEGIRQLARLTASHGYEVKAVRVSGCLHLKSAATRIDDDSLLVNPDWVDVTTFDVRQTIEVDPSEPHAANAVSLGNSLIYPTGFDGTASRLTKAGFQLELVDVGELQKAEGAVTCCSILLSE
jgi:dimethylargininase